MLNEFGRRVGTDDVRLGAVLRLDGAEAPEGVGLQVAWLRAVLDEAGFVPALRRALGLDRSEGIAEVGLGALGLLRLVSGLPELLAGLPASLLLNITASGRDGLRSGQLAEVARLAGGIASYSRSLPVALLIDDAELLEADLVERLVFTVLDRVESNVLAVVAVTPGAPVLRGSIPLIGTGHGGSAWGRSTLTRLWTTELGGASSRPRHPSGQRTPRNVSSRRRRALPTFGRRSSSLPPRTCRTSAK